MQHHPWKRPEIRAWLTESLVKTLEQASDEQPGVPGSHSGRLAKWRTAIVLVVAAFALTARDNAYAPGFHTITDWMSDCVGPSSNVLTHAIALATAPENETLSRLMWWSVWQFLIYVLVPAIVVRTVLRQPLSDYGLSLRGLLNGWWIYLMFYLLMVPILVGVSTSEAFQRTYPFYEPAAGDVMDPAYWSRFCIWQIFYAAQFVSLEFFFRGFLLHGTRRDLGAYSILVMMIPYCMIHFGKPLPETIGAIVAGIVLGFMSLKTRSIWLGAVLHISVALTMDISALYQRL